VVLKKMELKLGTFWVVVKEMMSQLDQRWDQTMVQRMDYWLEISKARMLVASEVVYLVE